MRLRPKTLHAKFFVTDSSTSRNVSISPVIVSGLSPSKIMGIRCCAPASGRNRMGYRDFDLKLSGAADDYYVEVIASPQSARTNPIPFQLDRVEIDSWKKNAALGLSIRQTTRTLGQALFNAVFPREVLSIWTETRSDANSDQPLRLRLDIRSLELANVPWEVMHDGTGFLSLTNSIAVVRFSQGRRWQHQHGRSGPLKVLLLTTAPRDVSALPNIEREAESILEVLRELRAEGKIERVDIIRGANRQRLQGKMACVDYHVLHYIGHGEFQNDKGSLIFENENGRSEPLDAETLSAFFADAPLRLLFLNSCETAVTSVTDTFAGVAHASLLGGVPAVVAMHGAVLDSAAAQFARRFYESLAAQKPIEFCMTEGRKVINNTGGADWSIPVLFSNSPDGLLWSVETGKVPSASLPASLSTVNSPKFVAR